MIKDKKIKPEYIIGIIIPIVIVGLIIFAANRGNDTYQSSNLKVDSYKYDTKKNNDNLLSKTSSTNNGVSDKANSNQIIGKWVQTNNYLLTIFRENDKCYIEEENRDGVKKNYELVEKNVQGNQAFVIKDLLEGTNVQSDVKFINEYTDYYIIDQDGELALYDNEGLIEKYRKIK